jgi:hypothetical protein
MLSDPKSASMWKPSGFPEVTTGGYWSLWPVGRTLIPEHDAVISSPSLAT